MSFALRRNAPAGNTRRRLTSNLEFGFAIGRRLVECRLNQMASLSALHSTLSDDPFRKTQRFSNDLAAIHEQLFSGGLSDEDRFALLRPWLMTQQPCLFGRIGAKMGKLSYCIITESDIDAGDEAVRDKIRVARRQWKRRAYQGLTSGFVIAAVSPSLTVAAPDAALQAFASRLAELYLPTQIGIDEIHHDDLFLPLEGEWALRWRVGANFFGAAGDGRWWHDHRFPGGVALSMNSVGHMSKSSEVLNEAGESRSVPDSLAVALRLAMQTIGKAASACSGPATRLLPRSASDGCPHADDAWPAAVKGKDRRTYKGWYHTDVTIPSVYFRSEGPRPDDVAEVDLDFSYLWDAEPDNPDHQTMGLGEEVPR